MSRNLFEPTALKLPLQDRGNTEHGHTTVKGPRRGAAHIKHLSGQKDILSALNKSRSLLRSRPTSASLIYCYDRLQFVRCLFEYESDKGDLSSNGNRTVGLTPRARWMGDPAVI